VSDPDQKNFGWLGGHHNLHPASDTCRIPLRSEACESESSPENGRRKSTAEQVSMWINL
jgi:hypothetical protein